METVNGGVGGGGGSSSKGPVNGGGGGGAGHSFGEVRKAAAKGTCSTGVLRHVILATYEAALAALLRGDYDECMLLVYNLLGLCDRATKGDISLLNGELALHCGALLASLLRHLEGEAVEALRQDARDASKTGAYMVFCALDGDANAAAAVNEFVRTQPNGRQRLEELALTLFETGKTARSRRIALNYWIGALKLQHLTVPGKPTWASLTFCDAIVCLCVAKKDFKTGAEYYERLRDEALANARLCANTKDADAEAQHLKAATAFSARSGEPQAELATSISHAGSAHIGRKRSSGCVSCGGGASDLRGEDGSPSSRSRVNYDKP
jgi:hypothetical protein